MAERKRVLILANSLGGLYDFRNEFVMALLRENEVYVSVPDEVRKEEICAEGAQVIHTDINRRGVNPLQDIRLYLAYRRLMRELKPDIVVTYTIKPNIYGGFCAGRLHIPYISTITGLGGAFDRNGLFVRLIVGMYRAGVKNADCVFFQNAENRDIFRSYHIAGKGERLVMGSGVNLSRHPFVPYPENGETRFLYVGRVMRERGILEFIEAARALHSDKVFFDILGACDEDYRDMLDALEREGVVRQLGFHTDVHPYLARASAVVVASFHEGMSNSLIEAAATGRPVIASNISGCMEAFEEGRTGFGFTPGHADELIAALQKFLSLSMEERGRMGRAGREKMEREFDREHVTAAYMEEVHRIMQQP